MIFNEHSKHLTIYESEVSSEQYFRQMICVCRFLIPSTRNRHIARAHGKYGRRYDQDGEDGQGQEEFESGTFIGFSIWFTNRVFRKL